MKSSTFAARPGLHATQLAKKQVKANLAKYDQQYFFWGRCINSILYKPASFLHQRKCEEGEQWIQKYFSKAEASKQIEELVEYYRFYKNSPTLAHVKYLEFMGSYWNKKKYFYYRRIKRQLQIEEQVCEQTAEHNIQQVAGKGQDSLWTGTFQLPSQLASRQITLHTDPDATIRRLLLTMSAQKQHKSTRQVSKIAEFHQKSGKSHIKSHLKTNPSQIISTSEFKKSKRKQTHKSMSNEPKVCHFNKSNERKINPTSSCQKIGANHAQFTLNYQRRNKPKQTYKQPTKKRLSNTKEMPTTKKKQVNTKKGKSAQKSVSILCRSKSGRKSKQIQTTANVKAVIDKVKDRIKAQKNVMLKKYIQSRQSCKSNDSTRGQTAKRYHK